jgi:hypothetical protein
LTPLNNLINTIMITGSNGTYVSYCTDYSGANFAVKRWNGTGWTQLGSAVTTLENSGAVAMRVVGTDNYRLQTLVGVVCYEGEALFPTRKHLKVKVNLGNQWMDMGTAGLPSQFANSGRDAFCVTGGVPYIACRDTSSGALSVYKLR